MRTSLAPQPQWLTLWREPMPAKRPDPVDVDFTGVARVIASAKRNASARPLRRNMYQSQGIRPSVRCCSRRARRRRTASDGGADRRCA